MKSTSETKKNVSNVDRVYNKVKPMATNFQFKPDERINETNLAKQLQTSRTPLREALNRLSAEGLLTFKVGKGFYCHSFNTKKVSNLYEARKAIECQATVAACERASDEALADFVSYAEQFEDTYSEDEIKDLVNADEAFHMKLAALSGNTILVTMLENINARIHFVRCIDMGDKRHMTHGIHVEISRAVAKRDTAKAIKLLEEHVDRRRDEIAAVVREGFAQLYFEHIDEGTLPTE